MIKVDGSTKASNNALDLRDLNREKGFMKPTPIDWNLKLHLVCKNVRC